VEEPSRAAAGGGGSPEPWCQRRRARILTSPRHGRGQQAWRRRPSALPCGLRKASGSGSPLSFQHASHHAAGLLCRLFRCGHGATHRRPETVHPFWIATDNEPTRRSTQSIEMKLVILELSIHSIPYSPIAPFLHSHCSSKKERSATTPRVIKLVIWQINKTVTKE
jgi:hypothetical protein